MADDVPHDAFFGCTMAVSYGDGGEGGNTFNGSEQEAISLEPKEPFVMEPDGARRALRHEDVPVITLTKPQDPTTWASKPFAPSTSDIRDMAVALLAAEDDVTFSQAKANFHTDPRNNRCLRVAQAAFDHAGYVPAIAQARRDAAGRSAYVTSSLWSDDTYRALLAENERLRLAVGLAVACGLGVLEHQSTRVTELEAENERLRGVIAYADAVTHGRKPEKPFDREVVPPGPHLAALRDLP